MSKTESMNKDLLRWLEKSESGLKEKKDKKRNKIPSGNCEICGQKTATSVCLKCDKSVCKSCYFKIIGICKKCVSKDISSKWDGSRPDWEKELGVEWVD